MQIGGRKDSEVFSLFLVFLKRKKKKVRGKDSINIKVFVRRDRKYGGSAIAPGPRPTSQSEGRRSNFDIGSGEPYSKPIVSPIRDPGEARARTIRVSSSRIGTAREFEPLNVTAHTRRSPIYEGTKRKSVREERQTIQVVMEKGHLRSNDFQEESSSLLMVSENSSMIGE
ncbi:hypothetical protein V1477_015287 [Vespula maculifrons]|uniref:Uncharacterized protein n=1 Tax=Vespula maculifrons TaxID=7453 RepID=A0ABD2BJU8_VESMC